MKIYSIVITIAVILAVIGGIYFFKQYGEMKRQYDDMTGEIKDCQLAGEEMRGELDYAQEQLARINESSSILSLALNAFMIPGDSKAIAIGSQESAEIENKIAYLADSKDRMMAQEHWMDFKDAKMLNSLFNFLRTMTDNINRTLELK